MELVKIPFDVETAKQIQARKVEGKIVDIHGHEYQLVTTNREGNFPIIAYTYDPDRNCILPHAYSINGVCHESMHNDFDLSLMVPEWRAFKEGDYLILQSENEENMAFCLILKNYEGGINPIRYHVMYNITEGRFRSNEGVVAIQGSTLRFASKEDVEFMNKILLKNQLEWNGEKKQVLPIKNRRPEHQFKLKDWVLCRDTDVENWVLDIFLSL